MFSLLKVRKDQAHGDYSDPGWFKHPADTQAKLWSGAVLQHVNAPPSKQPHAAPQVEVQVVKPGHGGGHHDH